MTAVKFAGKPKSHRIRQTRADTVFDICVGIMLTLILILVAYPLYFILIASVSSATAVNTGQTMLWPVGLNLDGYEKIFQDSRILLGYRNSLFYTVFGTALGVVLTIMAGYGLARPGLKGRNFLMGLFVFTMYFQGGLIPSYLLIQQLGLLNTYSVLILLGSFSVYNLIICRTFFQSSLSQDMREAAEIDGCGELRYFLQIALPLSKSIVAIMALYYAVGHWNSYFSALIYVYDKKFYPLQLFLREILLTAQTVNLDDISDPEALVELQNMSELIKYGVIVVSSLPMLILYPFIQKHFVKGVMIGAVKG